MEAEAMRRAGERRADATEDAQQFAAVLIKRAQARGIEITAEQMAQIFPSFLKIAEDLWDATEIQHLPLNQMAIVWRDPKTHAPQGKAIFLDEIAQES